MLCKNTLVLSFKKIAYFSRWAMFLILLHVAHPMKYKPLKQEKYFPIEGHL